MADLTFVRFTPARAVPKLAFTTAEWRRLAGLYGVVAALHLSGWGLYLHYAARHPALVGLGFTAYMFGLRHAFDADHIAAIDDTVRFMLQKGQRPLGIGFFFSLGHSTIVLALAVASRLAATAVSGTCRSQGRRQPDRRRRLGHVPVDHRHPQPAGAARHPRRVAEGEGRARTTTRTSRSCCAQRGLPQPPLRRPAAEAAESQLADVSARPALRPRLRHRVGSRAAGDDRGRVAPGNLPIPAVLCLPILFAAGMSLMDTTDGVLMAKAYNWAFVNPLRKIFYNLTTTSLSIVVALVIGTIELLQVLIGCSTCTGRSFDAVAGLDFGVLGLPDRRPVPARVGRFRSRCGSSAGSSSATAQPSRCTAIRTRTAAQRQHVAPARALRRRHAHPLSLPTWPDRIAATRASPHSRRRRSVRAPTPWRACSATSRQPVQRRCARRATRRRPLSRVVFGQLPALRELHARRRRWRRRHHAGRARRVRGAPRADARRRSSSSPSTARAFRSDATRWTTSLPAEQGGFSLRVDVDFAGDAAAATRGAITRVAFANRNYAGRFGWQRDRRRAVAGRSRVFDTDAFATSLTGGLTEALQALPAAGPCSERAIHCVARRARCRRARVPLAPRPGTAGRAIATARRIAQPPARTPADDALQARTRRLVDLISAHDAPWHGDAARAARRDRARRAACVLARTWQDRRRRLPRSARARTARHAVFLGTTVTSRIRSACSRWDSPRCSPRATSCPSACFRC